MCTHSVTHMRTEMAKTPLTHTCAKRRARTCTVSRICTFCLYFWINACWWEKFLGTRCCTHARRPCNGGLRWGICLWSCLFDPSVLDFSKSPGLKKMSAGYMDYMPEGWWGGVGGIISHSSCLRDKAVCLTSHINNVTGTNLPGLWRSHGSPIIPFDWEMTFIVGRSEMTSPWQIFDRAKRSDNPSPPPPPAPTTSALSPSPSISSPVYLFCWFCFAQRLFRKKKSAAVLSRRWIR